MRERDISLSGCRKIGLRIGRKYFLFFMVLSIAIHANTQTIHKIKIACIGASITEGARLDDKKKQSYPGQR